MLLATDASARTCSWTLAEFGEGEHQRRTFNVPSTGTTLGRSSDAGITIEQRSVSKLHARLVINMGQLFVEDLGSTNGTFVNGNRTVESAIVAGDLLQLGNAFFRVELAKQSLFDGTIEESMLPWAQTLMNFDRLLSERSVVPHFQPIVDIRRQSTEAYELLARSDLPELQNPAAMFGAAERLGQQATLSEIMRDEGMVVARNSTARASRFFLNTHPQEVINDRLVSSLERLRNDNPEMKLTIEIHEAAVTDPTGMRRMRDVLQSLDMELSYDDFGAGQGRLLELCEVPPHVLKFDMQLIRDIDRASASRQDLLCSLVRIAHDLGTTPLAEGVESKAEHDTCTELGFELAQGFYYSRPMILPQAT